MSQTIANNLDITQEVLTRKTKFLEMSEIHFQRRRLQFDKKNTFTVRAAEQPVFQPLPFEKTPMLSCCSFLRFWSRCAFMVIYLFYLDVCLGILTCTELENSTHVQIAESPELNNSHHHGICRPQIQLQQLKLECLRYMQH